jgi:serine/threonine-protein kinase
MTYDEAEQSLLQLGITIDQIKRIDEYSETIEAGEVISQDPVSGTGLTSKDTITLKVSSGSEYAALNDLSGQDKATAESTISNLGLKYSEQQEFSDDVEKGKVIRTDPGAGSIKLGSNVTVYVSKGPENEETSFDVTISAKFTGSGDQQDTITVMLKDAKNATSTRALDFKLDKNTSSMEQSVSVTIIKGESATIEVQRNGNSAVTKNVQKAETISVP